MTEMRALRLLGLFCAALGTVGVVLTDEYWAVVVCVGCASMLVA